MEANTARCPMCQWVSVVRVTKDSNNLGDYFACTNPRCQVERIYGENAIFMRDDETEKKIEKLL